MERTFEQTTSHLRMLLRDQPPDTTADLTDGAIVYLDGNTLRGVFLSGDEPDGLDAPFSVDEWFVDQVHEQLTDWLEHPRFTHRPLLPVWASDAPPIESAD